MIICPDCGESTQEKYRICPTCKTELLLKGRYQLMKVLGENIGITYLAKDVSKEATFQQVVIKELTIKSLDQWKTEELFKREGNVLKTLNHPSIPKFVDQFTLQINRNLSYFLVIEYIEGTPIDKEGETKHYTEEDIYQLLNEVLDALNYLHKLYPPIVHRDIKPSNLIRRLDGRISLIDFGGVKDAITPYMGSTVAGTFGYAPPEQLLGEACEESDLYSLGMTALVLLTKRDINDISEQLNLNSPSYEFLSPKMLMLLDKLLIENLEDRFQSAEDVLDFIEHAKITEKRFLKAAPVSKDIDNLDLVIPLFEETKMSWEDMLHKNREKQFLFPFFGVFALVFTLLTFEVSHAIPYVLAFLPMAVFAYLYHFKNLNQLLRNLLNSDNRQKIAPEALYVIFLQIVTNSINIHSNHRGTHLFSYYLSGNSPISSVLTVLHKISNYTKPVLDQSKLLLYKHAISNHIRLNEKSQENDIKNEKKDGKKEDEEGYDENL